jgi:HSP20 family protein
MFSLMPSRRERREGRELAPREFPSLDLFRREFASLFDRFFAPWPTSFTPFEEVTKPWGLEMEEKDREVVIRAEVPGFEPGELDVRLTGDVLTIRAEHKEETKAEGEKPAERRHGWWERTVTLPTGIEPEKVEARYHSGVLEIHVPKIPGTEPRRIEVKT